MQVFISYAGDDAFEAGLLQYALEVMLATEQVVAWTYQRDQARSESDIAFSLKERVRESKAMLFLISPSTLEGGATQWMELAYAHAFDIPIYVLLHRLDFDALRAQKQGVPPLLLASQCTPAVEWKRVVEELRSLLRER